MGIVKTRQEPGHLRAARASAPHAAEPVEEHVPAWEQIEDGRFRPRRIRGSFPGRELG